MQTDKYNEIELWLKAHKVNKYEFRQENDVIYVDVFSSIQLNKLNISTIPFKFGIIFGNFSINYNFLTDCSSLPEIVHGHFSATHNKIENFENSNMIEIDGICDFTSNKITSLNNFPKVLNSVNLGNNKIKSLEGIPKKINGSLNLSENILTNLDYLPIKINGDLICVLNNITSFSSLQKTKIIGKLNMEYNQLKNCKNIPDLSSSIILRHNMIESLEGLPINVNGNLDLGFNNLVSLKHCPQTILGSLNINDNALTNFQYIATSTQDIFAYENQITSFKGLEKCSFDNLICSNNKIKSLKYLPNKLKGHLSIEHNKITSLLHCPEEINGELNLSNNHLTSLEHIAKKINADLIVSNNPLKDIKHLPDQLRGYFIMKEPNIFNTDIEAFTFKEIKKMQLYYDLKEEKINTESTINTKKIKI